MKVETLRLALAALEGEYDKHVDYSRDAMDEAFRAEARGKDNLEFSLRAVSEYWDDRATQTFDAMQELEAALDEAEKETA